MWNYSAKLLDHFYNPRNVGEIEHPDGVGEVGALACGDALQLMIKVDKENRITEAKFKTFGCGSAIAAASALTEMIKGKTIDEAAQITNIDIANFLGGIPEEKMHCSVMGREALEAALNDYLGRPTKIKEGNIVCKCFGVTDKEIIRVVKENNLTTVEQVTNYCKAGGGCKLCHPQIEELIEQTRAEMQEQKKPLEISKDNLSPFQRMKLIEKTVEEGIRPMLQRDGGDIELVDIDGNKVVVSLKGACVGCPSAGITLTDFVETRLREFVSPDIIVEEVKQ